MLTTRSLIDFYAERIELAYDLRRPNRKKTRVSSRVWLEAAKILLSVHERHLTIAPDPELYVASQPMPTILADPWGELIGQNSARRYRLRIDTIVRGLRRELTGEIRYAERRTASGESAVSVLGSKCSRLSPLGRYIAAQRASLGSLAERFVEAATEQHNSCPLYRSASRNLLPPHLYPVAESSDEIVIIRPLSQIHFN